MATPEPEPRLPASVRLVGLLVIQVGAVVALHQLGRHPSLQVDWSDLDRWLDDTDPIDALMAAGRIVALVIAWWMLASTVLYVVAALTRAPAALRSVRWATLPGLRRLVDGALALSIAGSITLADTGAAHAEPTVEVGPEPDRLPDQRAGPERGDVRLKMAVYPAVSPLPDPDPEADTHTVVAGESLYSIAEDRLGDPERWPEIWHANRARLEAAGFTDPSTLQIGWVLQLPHQPPRPEALASESSAGEGARTHQVEAGEDFWSIAETELARQWGRAPTPGEVHPYWQAVIAANQERLLPPGNADLIYPDQEFTLPPVPADPATPTPEVSAPPSEAEPAAEPTSSDSSPLPAPDTGPPSDTSTGEAGGDGSSPGTVPPPSTSTTSEPTSDDQVPETEEAPVLDTPTTAPRSAPVPTEQPPSSKTAHAEHTTSSESPIRYVVAASAALAGLVLAVIARRRLARRRTARPGTTTPPRPDEDVAAERSLGRQAGDVMARAELTSRALAPALRAVTDPPEVAGLVISPQGDVTVCLVDPPPPEPPFVDDPAGSGNWYLDGTEDPEIDPEEEPVLCTLVSLGHTDSGDWVMVDLESLGALEIEGPADTAERMIRSVTAELALQPLDHLIDLIVAGGDSPETTTQALTTCAELDETAVQRIERTASETAAYLTDGGHTITTAARAHGMLRDALVATVVVAGPDSDPVLLERVTHVSLPGNRGVAVVARDPLGAEAVRVHVIDNDRVEIPHLGLVAQAAILDQADMDRFDELVRSEPEVVTPIEEPTAPASTNSNGSKDAAPDGHTKARLPSNPGALKAYEPPEWDYCVRIFADHQVETSSGDTVSFRYGENPDVRHKNTHRGPELLSYLALQRDRSATFDHVADDLWWKRPVKRGTVEKAIYGTRGIVGEERLSHAQGTPQRYHLADSVTTDVQLLEHALVYASVVAGIPGDGHQNALDALWPHLDRIEAPPFRTSYLGEGLSEWAAANRILDRVEQPVIDAAVLAAEIITQDQGDDGAADALWAIDQALKACPYTERLIRAAMELAAQLGQREAADRRYMALATHLARDELDPEPETTELRRRIMASNYKIG